MFLKSIVGHIVATLVVIHIVVTDTLKEWNAHFSTAAL